MTAPEHGAGRKTVAVYGRDELIDRVSRSRGNVLLVTGDTGVGKSEVLVRAQEASAGLVAPAPVTLDGSPGNLQRALLAALADALALVVRRRGPGFKVAQRIEAAALQIARERANDLSKALAAELLALVRHKLGPEVGRGIADFITKLRDTADGTLDARINAASDPSIAQILLALASAVSKLAEGEPLLLALDAAESMTSADRGVLGDLAADSSTGVRLRLGFATSNTRQRTAVDELLAKGPGVQEISVGGLAVDAVTNWLRAAGLDQSLAGRVHRLTAGYPLLIQSVIADVRAGGDVESAPLNQAFATQTVLAWDALDPDARVCARKLSVLPEPLPDKDCAELCSMSLAEYADAVDRLRHGFILATVVNGSPWFHEQRRTFVLRQMRPPERAEASAKAAEAVLRCVVSGNDLGWVQPLADIVAYARPLLDADEKLAAAIQLPRAELAICAALLELGEKQRKFVVNGDEILLHAREWFGLQEDLIPALRALARLDLLALVEETFGSAVQPRWSLMTTVTLQGRAAREFGRMPIPSLTTAIFALGVRAKLGQFERLAHGVGRPSWTAIAQSLLKPRKQGYNVRAATAFGEMRPALLARGRFGGRPLYWAARYASLELREEALRALEGLHIELLGDTLQVDETLPNPSEAVASDRFVIALERAAGSSLARTNGPRRVRHALEAPVDLTRRMELKAQTYSLIRGLCSTRERVAAELGQPTSWHWLAGDDWVTEGAVRGAGEGAVHHPRPPERENNDPFEAYRLTELFGLPSEAWLGPFVFAAGSDWMRSDPVVDVVGRVSEAMRQFNGVQEPRVLPLVDTDLAAALLGACRRSLEDARCLAAELPVLGQSGSRPTPEALYLVLIRPDRAGYYDGYLAAYETAPSQTGEEEVRVAFIDASARDEDEVASDSAQSGESPEDFFRRKANRLMRAGFDRDAAGKNLTEGDAHGLIAGLLGYDERDIRLVDDGCDESQHR